VGIQDHLTHLAHRNLDQLAQIAVAKVLELGHLNH